MICVMTPVRKQDTRTVCDKCGAAMVIERVWPIGAAGRKGIVALPARHFSILGRFPTRNGEWGQGKTDLEREKLSESMGLFGLYFGTGDKEVISVPQS